MLQDILVYCIIAAAAGKTLYELVRFILPKPGKQTGCSGCSSCSPVSAHNHRHTFKR